MPNGDETRRGRKWKQKIASEMAAYWIFVRYLSILFRMFIAYQRLILAQHAISLEEFVRRDRYELLARCLVVFFAFIPSSLSRN